MEPIKSKLQFSPLFVMERSENLSDEKDVETAMAFQLLRTGYGYDTVMAVLGWNQKQADAFQSDIVWEMYLGTDYGLPLTRTCKAMDFNSDDWKNDWLAGILRNQPTRENGIK